MDQQPDLPTEQQPEADKPAAPIADNATQDPITPPTEAAPQAATDAGTDSPPAPDPDVEANEHMGEDTPRADATGEDPAAEATDAGEAASDAADAPAEAADSADAAEQSSDATADDTDAGEAATPDGDAATAGGDAAPKKPKGKPKARKKKPRRRPPPRAPEPPLPPELKAEAAEAARAAIVKMGKGAAEATLAALDLLGSGHALAYVARFRRRDTQGLDEARLRALRDAYASLKEREERRVAMRALLEQRGALTDEAKTQLGRAETIGEMEDLAAPFLPVVASRATVARGAGLQPLADAVRAASETMPLSELAKPFVADGAEGPIIDQALAAARDIVAEEVCLDPKLRARLRKLFRKEARVKVNLRSERKGDAGRHAGLVGFDQVAHKVPAMKILGIRRAEKDRVVVSTIEPPEEKALEIVHGSAAPEGHPHAGFLRAAAEDGYRRILKPVLQNELRVALKRKADDQALDTFERNLRNLLLGPVAGARRVMGLRPDVTGGHRWCTVDAGGLPTGSGQLPHEPTAGREACVAELIEKLGTYECQAIAVGRTGGRAEAVSLANEAAKSVPGLEVIEVADGGTRVLEAMGKLEFDDRPEVAPECRGALSLARRFQDPLQELATIDAKALALGPHIHDVHQGRLRTMIEDVLESSVAFVGPDPSRSNAEVLSHLPGFTRAAAQSFVKWREAGGKLTEKAQLAAVDGVGPEMAEQSVGFIRILDAADPRDRTQLHPSQYHLAEQIAASVDADVPTLFSDPRARSQARLDALVTDEVGLHTLKYVLYQATAGGADPRPPLAEVIPPPPEINLKTLRPGLMLQGRVIRAAPFGVFVDVGMRVDALIPTPHIGERPGLEQSHVAPVGAVINATVLDVEPEKRKLTLTMRADARGPARGPARGRGAGGRPPRGGGRGPDRRPARGQGAGRGQGQGAGRGQGAPAGRGFSAARGASGQRSAGAGAGRGQGGGRGPSTGRGPGGAGGRGAGGKGKRSGGRSGGGSSIFGGRGRGRDDRGSRGPRTISLKPDSGKPKDAEVLDESKLTPEELMQRKLDEMRRKLQGE